MYLTRYPFRSFNSPKPLFGCKFLPSILCPTREQWPPPLLSSISTINFLPEREREEELSFCYLFSSRRFSRQKIIRDLILNFSLRKIPPSISVEIIASNKNRESIPKRGTRGREASRRMVARSFDSNLFTFASLVHGTACRALWTTPDAAIDFVLAHEPAQHTPFAATPLHE